MKPTQEDVDQFNDSCRYYTFILDNGYIIGKSTNKYHIYPYGNQKTHWKWVNQNELFFGSWYIFKGYDVTTRECLDGAQNYKKEFYISNNRYPEESYWNHFDIVLYNTPALKENWDIVHKLLDI